MTSRTDDEQYAEKEQWPEQGLPEEEQENYKHLFKYLEREPHVFLPSTFPDKVVARVERKGFIRDRFRQMAILAFTISLIFLLFALASLVLKVSLVDDVFQLLLDYLPHWASLLLLLGLVQTADTLLIRGEAHE